MEKGNEKFTFSALGTKWEIVTDGEALSDIAKNSILEYVKTFEKRFSRFLPDSEVNAFRNSSAGEYEISKEFASLLTKVNDLRVLTGGVYDPAVAILLERAGYDSKYTMIPSEDAEEFVLPKWKISGETLTLDGPTVFDFGGIGKGYCIDRVVEVLKSFGYKYFLVDGGGDMFGTVKLGDKSWGIAIEYPGKPEMAAGMIDLKNQGLAVSDSFRRRWGKWHHLVNPQLKKSVETVIGAVAVAASAWDADCMTSALFFSMSDRYSAVSEFYKGSYLVFQGDGMAQVSPNWKGELF